MRADESGGERQAAAEGPRAPVDASRELGAVLDQHAIVAVTDDKGAMTFVNDGFCALSQYAREELVGRDHRLLNSGLHAPEFFRAMWTTIADGNVWRGEIRNRARDGSCHWLDATIVPLPGEDGAPKRYVALYADISQRKAQELEIARITRLHVALREINQAIVRLPDREALFQRVCEVVVRQGGFRMAWVGWHDMDTQSIVPVAACGDEDGYLRSIRIHSGDRPEGKGPTGTAYRTGRTYICNDLFADPATMPWRSQIERRGFRASAVFPIRVHGMVHGTLSVYSGERDFFQQEEIALLTDAALDISFALDNIAREEERKRGEAAAFRLAAVVESSQDAIISRDLDGVVTSWNDAAERIFGYTAEEMVGQPMLRLIPAERQAEEAHIIESVRRGTALTHFETVRRTKSGRLVDVSATTSPIRDGSGRIVGSSKIFRDIGGRKRAEDDVRRLNVALQERVAERTAALEQMRDLTRRLSEMEETARRNISRELHDRVGPNLVALKLSLGMMQADVPADTAGAGALQDARDVLEQTIAQLRNVMSDLRPPALDDYGLLAAIRSYAERYQARLGADVQVRGVDLSPRPSLAVETGLFRIAQEALNNIAKHASARHVEIAARRDKAGITLEIADDGVGFDPAVAARPGSHGLTTMGERAQGRGAALSITSRPGGPTRVVVELPC
jgi:PAS domain S-box-containing protein